MSEAAIESAVERFVAQTARLREEIQKLIVGQREVLDGLVTCLLASGHALVEGVPGLGKTVLVRSLAAALELRFGRIQFTPDLMPADVLGTTLIRELPDGRRGFEFEPGPVFANIVLADEINRTSPKTQSALLEAMQERAVTIGKTTHALPDPFLVLATQNPLEMEGTYPLPEAQLDRFLLKLQASFPDHSELHAILDRTTGAQSPAVQPVLSRDELVVMRGLVREVAVARHVQDFAVRLLEATHRDRAGASPLVKRYVRFGASPRGAQACLIAAKTRALLAGRLQVGIDDIRQVAKPALRHRLILNFEGQADGIDPDRVIDEVLHSLAEA